MQLFERTLGEWLEYWVEKTPDKEFIVYSDRDLRFTYKQFDQRVNNLAKGLLSIGVTTGSHVGIWATNVMYFQRNVRQRLCRHDLYHVA